jgi:aryl-alcohol dehydrogenase-like predicted oxidoreductase
MQRRQLGSSGLEISTIGLGTWAIGGWMWGGQDDAQSIAAIQAAVDHGVNWIDTAPIYGSGHSEKVVGDALKTIPATKRPLIFTKFGLGDNSDKPNKSSTAQEIATECEASLKRLGIERIDLYQLHWPTPQPIAETAAAVDKLLKAGKIRAIGVSNYSVEQLSEWCATGVPLHSLQAPYSILRPAAAKDVLPWCAKNGVGAIAYSPLLRGMLFGTWSKDKTFPADDGRAAHKDYSGARFQRHLQAIDELKSLAGKSGLSCPQLSVGALLHTPGLTGCIVGARNAAQGALIANLGVTITDEQAKAVAQIIERLMSDLAGIP